MSNLINISSSLYQFHENKKSWNEDYLKRILIQAGEHFGDFALIFKGYTPSFNDGDLVEHYGCWFSDVESADYEGVDREVAEEWFEATENENDESFEYSLVEYNDNIMKDDNGYQEFKWFAQNLESFIPFIYDTNYIVKVKVKSGEVFIEDDLYDCGY